MTNYTHQEFGVSPPAPSPEFSQTFKSEDEEDGTEPQQPEQRIDGMQVQPETSGLYGFRSGCGRGNSQFLMGIISHRD